MVNLKIVHFESGLGNQMLNYAEYLAIKENYNDVYIEKLIYETLPKNKGISQWNGFELEKLFDIKTPDFSSVVGDTVYNDVKDQLYNSQYWDNNWKYAEPIVNALNKNGYNIVNLCHKGTYGDKEVYSFPKQLMKKFCFGTRIGNKLFRAYARVFTEKLIKQNYENLFIQNENDFYCGQSLKFMYKKQGIEKIDTKLRESFRFKQIDERNVDYAKKLTSINSVAIHARRGDFISRNAFCYKYGYFKRSVRYMKKHVKNPVFVFFCDSDSINWVKENLKIFGLAKNDSIEFVDWNHGTKNYQDLYLMSKCKHNIITQSSFGWWGSWLNDNPNKITISPDCRINTTNWM